MLGSDLLVILNPASGPGDGLIDPNYVDDTAQGPFIDFRNAGGVAIGYIRTGWAVRRMDSRAATWDLGCRECGAEYSLDTGMVDFFEDH